MNQALRSVRVLTIETWGHKLLDSLQNHFLVFKHRFITKNRCADTIPMVNERLVGVYTIVSGTQLTLFLTR